MIKFWRFFKLSHIEKRLFFKAMYWLVRAKITIKFCGFDRLKPHLGEVSHSESAPSLKIADIPRARQIKQAISQAARVLPFHSQCLVTAITAKYLLNDQQFSCRLYLGVKKDDDTLAAHAWVKVGEFFISGQTAEQFTTVKVFQ